jgi:transcriptional regulator of acetoin/glycerol metabolism
MSRTARALEQGAARYPVYRELRFAARIELEVLLDAIALDPAWRAERMNAESLILDAEGLFVGAYGSRKTEYCSCAFYIWAADLARAEEAKQRILAKAGSTRITEPMFSINWHFFTSGGELQSASIEEMADDVLCDLAYPEIKGGVRAFVARYLGAPETVLVLQGPPGTGKTRLIRAILGEMSRRKGAPARALYTGDMKALASDEVFVKFITGEEDAFVVEDADHLLKPRADGNEHLHRFLTIADGVVRAQGRRIVFSTNLPNVGDLDDALIRPGRCFARVHVRALTGAEARALAQELAAGDAEKVNQVKLAFADEGRQRSLAEVYGVLR